MACVIHVCTDYFQTLPLPPPTDESRPTLALDLITDTVAVFSWTLPELATSDIALGPVDGRLSEVIVNGYTISVEETLTVNLRGRNMMSYLFKDLDPDDRTNFVLTAMYENSLIRTRIPGKVVVNVVTLPESKSAGRGGETKRDETRLYCTCDCLGCAVLLCLVCLFDLACFFLSSFSSLI